MRFADRSDAGRQLAQALVGRSYVHPLVLALPRGGVPVAFEVARALHAPLDVLVVRKIGAPRQPELGLGAVAETGHRVLDPGLVQMLAVAPTELEERTERAMQEAARRVRVYRKGRALPGLRGHTVILVDDGIATGGTAEAAISALKARGADKVVLAVPVAAASTMARLRPHVDEVVCLTAPEDLDAIGFWYDDFAQTTDDEVMSLLEVAPHEEAPAPEPAAPVSLPVRVHAGVVLDGDLTVPSGARGLVVFAHGSGSSRHSPRNRFVARTLEQAGLATLLFDLLTGEEEAADEVDAHLRFDIDLLALRLVRAVDWIHAQPELARLGTGLFGSSTGAAAALVAAAERPQLVRAVVSRGGRPDLASYSLPHVRAPTLLVVGGADHEVLALNREVLPKLGGPGRLEVVPHATHLFEEPGALAHVAHLAANWFVRFLPRSAAVEERPRW